MTQLNDSRRFCSAESDLKSRREALKQVLEAMIKHGDIQEHHMAKKWDEEFFDNKISRSLPEEDANWEYEEPSWITCSKCGEEYRDGGNKMRFHDIGQCVQAKNALSDASDYEEKYGRKV